MGDLSKPGLFERLDVARKGEATPVTEAPAEAEVMEMQLAVVIQPPDDDDPEHEPPTGGDCGCGAPPGATQPVLTDPPPTDVVEGTPDDDEIILTGPAIVRAGDGDDSVTGSDGSDIIEGGAGDDLMDGGAGNDTLIGGAGSDTLIGGEGNNLLIGDGGTIEDHTVTVTFQGGTAKFCSSLGIYVIDPCSGKISDVQMAFANASVNKPDPLVPGESTFSFIVPPGAQIGAFIVADGFTLNDYESFGPGQFAFVDAHGEHVGLDAKNPQLVHIGADGTVTGVLGPTYHSAAFGDNVGLNFDGNVQVKGLDDSDGVFRFGFEDMPARGEAGFDNVIFDIDLSNSGATFLNPDFDATSTAPDGDPDSSNLIIGGDGDDIIVTGAGGDVVQAGGGNDVIYATPGDTVDGGAGFDTLVLNQAGNIKSIDITRTVVNDDGTTSSDGTISFKDGSPDLEFLSIECIIPCFTPGTAIATPRGERLVEELQEGDKIITRDNGIQEIRWIGQRPMNWADLAANPHLKPIRIARGSLGNGLPERDMMVSPQHRFLVVNDRTQLYFDEHEVLVAAKHLLDHRNILSVDSIGVTYVHFMCDRHEVVLANGAWTETFQPGDYTLGGMGNAQRLELFELFPDLSTQSGRAAYASARKTLKRHEARLLAG